MRETGKELSPERPLSPEEVEKNAQRLLERLIAACRETKLAEFHRGDEADYLQERESGDEGIVFQVKKGGITEKYQIRGIGDFSYHAKSVDYMIVTLTTFKDKTRCSQEEITIQSRSPEWDRSGRKPAILYKKQDFLKGTSSELRNTESALKGAEKLTAKLEEILLPTSKAA